MVVESRVGSGEAVPLDAAATRSGPMEVAFRTRALRDACASGELMEKRFGPEVASMLKRRLSDLRAATSVFDLVLGDPKVVPGTCGRAMSVELCGGHRLVFRANHSKNPTLPDGTTDWSRVSRIQVLRIEKSFEKSHA
jgi:hypothetical protein